LAAHHKVEVQYTGWPPKVSHYHMIKNRIKSHPSLSVRLDLSVKLKYGSTTIMLFVGIRPTF